MTACNSAPVPTKTVVVQTPTPTPSLALNPIEVSKPINVSFSTYSKDWPVDWQWIDPDERYNPTSKNVKSGVLRMSVPSKKDLQGDNRTAPRYLKAVKGDFQIETRVKFSPKENYQGAGLLVYTDDNNYLRLERAYGGPGGGGEGIRLDAREAAHQKTIVTTNDVQTDVEEVSLKIVRDGGLFIAFWRESEENEWREVGEYQSNFPDTVLIGVAALNTARPMTADFLYIRLLPGLVNSR